MAGKTADYFTLNSMNIMSDYSYEVQLADVKIINGNKTELLVYGGGNAKNGATAMAENASVSVTRNHTSTNIGSPKGDYLHLLYIANNISSSLTSVRFSNEEYTVKPGDCLEYDIHCDNRLTNSGFGVDIKLKSGTDINASGWLDQNAIPGVIGIENRRLAGGWHHRKLNISGAAGETVTEWNFAGNINIPDELWQSIGRMFEADIDNVRITNNGKTVKEIYKDGAPADNTVVRRQSNMTVNLSSVSLEAPKPIYEAVTTVDGEVFVVAYNVKDFGAKGDGKTDDTNAFQSALYAAEKLDGGTVYAPAGNYKIEGRLYIPGAVTLLGDWHTPGSDGKETLLMAYSGKGDAEWLDRMYSAAEKEYTFWCENRMTESGLNRYYCDGKDGFGRGAAEYLCKRCGLDKPNEADIEEYSKCLMSFCESGWDCTSRFDMRAHEFNALDLNSLLYGMEKNMEYFSEVLKNGKSGVWLARAEKRKLLMNSLMWSEDNSAFYDYDFKRQKISDFFSAASFYPLAFGLATNEQAEKTVACLPKIEMLYGTAGCEKRNDNRNLQWDYPNGWGCLQYIVIKGLLNYGYKSDALRIAGKYASLVESNFEKTGTLWEKYNVVTGGASTAAEYETPTMIGWSTGIYLYVLKLCLSE